MTLRGFSAVAAVTKSGGGPDRLNTEREKDRRAGKLHN